MRAKGISPGRIAEAFKEEKILTLHDYLVKQTGKYLSSKSNHLWTQLLRREQFERQTELTVKKERRKKLDSLIESAFEEKLEGKIPADICVNLIEKYSAERQELYIKINELEQMLSSVQQANIDADEFIGRIKKHIRIVSVTRELCLELLDKIVVGAPHESGQPQNIEIYYKINLDAA